MFVVVHAVVRKIKGVGCVVCGMFYVLLGRTFVSGLRTKKPK